MLGAENTPAKSVQPAFRRFAVAAPFVGKPLSLRKHLSTTPPGLECDCSGGDILFPGGRETRRLEVLFA